MRRFWLPGFAASRYGLVGELILVASAGGHSGIRYIALPMSVEKKAVHEAFPGLSTGGSEITHLLCRVHYDRNIRKNFPGDSYAATRRHLMSALRFDKTQEKCNRSIAAAINACPKDEKKEFHQKEHVAGN